MQAEIITIGDEILIGQIIDTNSAFISKSLNDVGISVYQITSIQDDKQHILKALKEAEENVDLVIITGGLGPTKDDITKHTLAGYFSDDLIVHDETLSHIKSIWKNRIKKPLLQVNIDQANVLKSSEVLFNANGTAPGMWITYNNKIFVSLPGVPFEMKALLNKEVIPRLTSRYELPYILHKTILTAGIGESDLANQISQWEDDLPKHIKLAYLPSLGRVRLRLTAKGRSRENIDSVVQSKVESLLPLIKDYFIGFQDDKEIEKVIASHLTSKELTLSVSESCTGGKISSAITALSGASKYFKGGVVAYSDEIKKELLGILPDLIDEYTVYSHEVVEAMAEGTLKKFNSDYAIATSGNAGPNNASEVDDVGTVYIGIASKNSCYSYKFNFGKHRSNVINRSVTKCFELLLKEILKK